VLNFLIPRYGVTSGAIEGDFKLAGTWMRPLGKLNLRVNNLNQPTDIRHLPPGPYDLTCAMRIEGDRVLLDKLQAESPGLKVSVSGKWSNASLPADLLRSKKQILTGELDLEGSLDIPNLSWLARDLEGVRRVAGRLEARGKLQGPITAPIADATIRLSEGELSPDFDMPSLLALNMEARITPKKMRIQKLTGELGGSAFTLAGILDVSGSSESKTSLQLQGKDLLLFRNESLKLRADTDLTLKGEFPRLELTGEIAVTDGRVSKKFGLIEGVSAVKPATGGGFQLFSLKEPPFSDMVFSVRITAKEPIRIQNNLARGGIRPDLVLSGTGELPVLAGKVYVEPTRLYLPAGRMKLESGLVRFESSDPDHPKLYLVGTSSMLGYDITAIIEGPYNEPVVTLSSVPPLPDDELLMLLLAGQPPKKGGNRTGARSQYLNVAVLLGRDMIARLFGSDSEEADDFILDRFDVEVGRRVTREGEDTIHAEFRLADNVLRDKDSLYLTGERDVFDAYNLGVKIVFRFR
jgi:translocation and assembly module TamB